MRRAKIICTLGPASHDLETIEALVAAGMDCARLNFSHGDHAGHLRLAELVREAADRAGRPVALLGDLCGPKMRVGRFADGGTELVPGARFTLTARDVPGGDAEVSVSYPQLATDVAPGDDILLDDGLIRLRVVETRDEDVECEVLVGGRLTDRKGLNVPNIKLSVPTLTDKDRRDLAFAVDRIGVDFLALSFVRSADDVRAAQQLAETTPIIAKLEKPEAIEALEEIAAVAQGLMVARGDLGVELGVEKVPLVQKEIIRVANRYGRLVITATQMLDSMIRNPSPTRAEAADIANAVIDGSDALMLSGETAAGRHPIVAVRTMDRIIREVEGTWHAQLAGLDEADLPGGWDFVNAAAKAAALLSFALDLGALVVFTRDGRTARSLAEFRPRAPILAITDDVREANRLPLEWGVVPRVGERPDDLRTATQMAREALRREGIAAPGQEFAVVVGCPSSAGTNTVTLDHL